MKAANTLYDICIVGAGISGASLAISLGNCGYHVALIERNWDEYPDIVGELLQPGGVNTLHDLGLQEALTNIGSQAIKGYALHLENEWLKLSYPQIEGNEAKNNGLGFRYGNLVKNLRDLCRKNENVHCYTGSVNDLVSENESITGVEFLNSDNAISHVDARLTVISQGSIKSLGKLFNNASPTLQGFMLGLILRDCELPFPNHGHIILTDDSPILCYPVGNNQYRVLIDFNKSTKSPKGNALTKYLLQEVLPKMPDQLQDSFQNAVLERDFKSKPTYQLASRPIAKNGVLLLGDSLNMRHPITGGGMTVALTDVKLITEKLAKLETIGTNEQFYKMVHEFYIERHRVNASINILAFALYQVFRHKELRKACFSYLKKGGSKASEPMALLSGLARNKYNLIRHFLMVAGQPILDVKKLIRFEYNVFGSVRSIWDAVKIIWPLYLNEIPRQYDSISHSSTHLKTKTKSIDEFTKRKAKKPARTGA